MGLLFKKEISFFQNFSSIFAWELTRYMRIFTCFRSSKLNLLRSIFWKISQCVDLLLKKEISFFQCSSLDAWWLIEKKIHSASVSFSIRSVQVNNLIIMSVHVWVSSKLYTPIPRLMRILVPGKNVRKFHLWDCTNVSTNTSRNTNSPFRWFWILTVRVYPMFFLGNWIFQNSWL